MRILLVCFSLLSAGGLALSVLAHTAALRGTEGPLGAYTPLLHAGLFVVWIPAVLVSRRRVWRNRTGENGWQVVFRGCPAWLKYMTYILLGYAVVNLLLFMSTVPKPSVAETRPARQLDLLSGCWMAFYSMALAMLYSAWKALGTGPERRGRHSGLTG